MNISRFARFGAQGEFILPMVRSDEAAILKTLGISSGFSLIMKTFDAVERRLQLPKRLDTRKRVLWLFFLLCSCCHPSPACSTRLRHLCLLFLFYSSFVVLPLFGFRTSVLILTPHTLSFPSFHLSACATSHIAVHCWIIMKIALRETICKKLTSVPQLCVASLYIR